MSKLGDAAAQTLVRRRLLANGYTPLANKDKMCVLPGWSDMHVDDAQIDVWSRQLKWRATGVRVERGLAVIDLDVNDAEAVEAIIDAIPAEIWSILQDAPVRRGKGAKEAWFVRLEDGEQPFYRLASAGFRQEEGDETVHRVEIFAGEGGGRQFGAYGAHTVGDDGEVRVVYHWVDDRGLLQVPFDDLPRLTRAQLSTVAEVASRTLESIGWLPDLRSKPGFSSNQPIYDLDLQEFETQHHGAVDLMGLQELCEIHGDVRLSASWLEGGAAVNTTRCIASIHPRDGRVSILETASFEIHRPKDLAPKPVTLNAIERLQELAQAGSVFSAAAPAPTAADIGADMADDMSAVVDALLSEYCFMPSEQRCIVPLTSPVEGAMTLANFRTLMQPHAVTVAGKKGGEKVIHPVPMWMADPRRVDVAGYRYRPDVDGPLATVDGRLFINTYRAPVEAEYDDAAGPVAAFEALIAHLLPVEAERDWFRMWVAAKVQRPWVIGCGVLMVASIQGTGRGTLFDMLGSVFGPRNVSPVSSVELLGGGGQGQYNGWLSDSVLVTCDEVMAGDDGGGSMTWKRRESYERLKQYTDPRRREVLIRKKNVNAYTAEIFASMLLATNHLNALPLTVDDRRFAVLMQEDIKFINREGLPELVNPWRPEGVFEAAFGSALRAYLRGVAVDWTAVREAPNLGEGRLIMQQQNEGDVEDILRDVLSRVPADYIASEDLRRRLQIAITAYGEGDHLKNWWRRTQDILRAENSMGWKAIQTRQTVVGADGRQKLLTVYYRAADGVRQAWSDTALRDRAALLAPGSDVNRNMTALEQAKRDGTLRAVE
jgi:hypothetical protein